MKICLNLTKISSAETTILLSKADSAMLEKIFRSGQPDDIYEFVLLTATFGADEVRFRLRQKSSIALLNITYPTQIYPKLLNILIWPSH